MYAHGLMWVQIRRPDDFDPDTALLLGPVTPDPTMDITDLDIVKSVSPAPHPAQAVQRHLLKSHAHML